MALQCDAYRGVGYDGYQIVVFVDVAGVTYSRTINVGPETYREQPWAAVAPEP